MSVRLTLATEAGFVPPDTGVIGLFGVTPEFDLSALPADQVEIVQGFRPHHDHFQRLGLTATVEPSTRYAASVVALPKSKPAAQALIWQALAQTDGPVSVDGQKGDGIDSMLKAVRARVSVSAPISKAHGKLFWFTATPDEFPEWQGQLATLEGGLVTAPGCFSADGPDPASVLLGDVLPAKLGKRVVDLGAGWGYLSRRILERGDITRLDLVEADHAALDCARRNVTDPRAQFHWADARDWQPLETPDVVVMNPPFHTGRATDPGLGRDFIAAAARILPKHGALWLVANRHLPYEPALDQNFRDWSEIDGTRAFKILRAVSPTRNRR